MTFTPLTREQMEAMPPAMRTAREARWRRIVRDLQADHYARFHGEQDARIAEWAQRRRDAA
jgi:hypothetical protein